MEILKKAANIYVYVCVGLCSGQLLIWLFDWIVGR
jgi:hypothetical protein